jgi:LysM repeat protein
VSFKSFLTLTALALATALVLAACGGDGGGAGGRPNPRKVPTATAFAVLPEPTILSGGLLVTEGGGGDTYVVKPGDTLAAIAAELEVTVEEIIRLNDLADPSRLEVDQVLKIPPRGGAQPTPIPADETPIAEETPEAPIGADEYEVQSGDNASDIAARFGVTLQELADANGTTIDGLRTLFVGQVLVIPQFPGRTPVPTSIPEPEPVPTEEVVEEPTEEPAEEPPPEPVESTPVEEPGGAVETETPEEEGG